MPYLRFPSLREKILKALLNSREDKILLLLLIAHAAKCIDVNRLSNKLDLCARVASNPIHSERPATTTSLDASLLSSNDIRRYYLS